MPEQTLDLAKPFFLVKILDKDSGNVKFVWSPNLFLDEERPSDTSQIAPESNIEDIEIKSNFEPPINTGEIKIDHGIGMSPDIAVNDKLKIFLGYYLLNSPQSNVYSLAYTGVVSQIKAHLNHTIVKSISQIKTITDSKRNLSFSRTMTITDIIQKLAIDDGGLESSSNGISSTSINKQKGYSISNNISIYQHIKKLANFVGFDIYMDVFDKFNARLWEPEAAPTATGSDGQTLPISWLAARDDSETDVQKQLIHSVYFGVNALDMELDIKGTKKSAVNITSLADSEGDEVFTIEPPVSTSTNSGGGSGSGGGSSSGTGTSSSSGDSLVLPRFTREDADQIAETIIEQSNSGLSGSLTILGAPQFRLGDGIKLSGFVHGRKPFPSLDIPTSDYDASYSGSGEESSSQSSGSGGEEKTFKIKGIRHLFNDTLGFITKLMVVEAAPAGVATAGEAGTAAGTPGAGAGGVEETTMFGGGPSTTATEAAEEEEEEEEELEEVDYLTLAGVNFNFDSAVVLTRDLGDIKAIIEKVNRSEKKLLIAGHTDRMGSETYNLNLSALRAKSVLAIGTGNDSLWREMIDSGKWVVKDYQAILKDFGLYEGDIDGIDGPMTKAALRDFQSYYKEKHDRTIVVDGLIGPRTWVAIFNVMVDKMEAEFDSGKFKDPKWIGCGEYRPIVSPDVDEVRSEANRRVEFLLYPDHKFPKIPQPQASRAATEAAYNDSEYHFNKVEYTNIPLDVTLRPSDEPGEEEEGELSGLAWDSDTAVCGSELTLTGEATGFAGRDAEVTVYLRDRREDGVLETFDTTVTGEGTINADWVTKNLPFEAEGDAFPEEIETLTEVAIGETTSETEDALTIRRIPDIEYQQYNQSRSSNRTSEGLPNYGWTAVFRQNVVGFTTNIALTLHTSKGWLGHRIRIGSTNRWAKQVGSTWQYHDGTNWVNVPGDISSYTVEEVVFRQDGSNFVSDTPGITGTWPEAFTDFTISEEKLNDWLDAIHNIWDDKFYLKREGCPSENDECCRYTVRVVANFSETEGDSPVRVVNGNGRSNSAQWFLGDTDNEMAAHEAGHLFGNYDEYDADGAIDTSDSTFNHVPDSIMGENMNTAYDRHYTAFAEHLGSMARDALGVERVFGVIEK